MVFVVDDLDINDISSEDGIEMILCTNPDTKLFENLKDHKKRCLNITEEILKQEAENGKEN